MFQPQINTNVYRPFRQRLSAIERIVVSGEAGIRVLTRTSNQLNQIIEQFRRVEDSLNDGSRSSLNEQSSPIATRPGCCVVPAG